MQKRGKFIVFDGMDCSGKSTQLRILEQGVAQTGCCAIFTRDPGGSVYAEEIRDLVLNHPEAHRASPRTRLLLFWASRSVLMEEVVLPHLFAGTHVFVDRFDSTTFAYQLRAEGGKELEPLFYSMRQCVLRDVAPDLYVLFDLSPEEAKRRSDAREGQTNHFDAQPIDFYQRAREGFKDFQENFPLSAVTIDASGSVEDVRQAVRKELLERLGVEV